MASPRAVPRPARIRGAGHLSPPPTARALRDANNGGRAGIAMDYFIHIATLVAIYAILAVSLDLLVGETGILSLAHASFFGVGAYSTAHLSGSHGERFLFAMLA